MEVLHSLPSVQHLQLWLSPNSSELGEHKGTWTGPRVQWEWEEMGVGNNGCGDNGCGDNGCGRQWEWGQWAWEEMGVGTMGVGTMGVGRNGRGKEQGALCALCWFPPTPNPQPSPASPGEGAGEAHPTLPRGQECQECPQVLPCLSHSHPLTLAFVSCIPVLAGEAALEAQAGLEGFGGAACRRGDMEPGGLAGQGEHFLDVEMK